MLSNKPLEKFAEFDDHELISFVFDKNSKLRGFISIHKTRKNYPSLGATRLWSYPNEIEAVQDSLRLSKLMSYKSALAGLKYGGAKATLIMPKRSFDRKKLFSAYAKKVNELGGRFITGTDVGLDSSDIRQMKKHTKYVIGRKVDPAYYTAIGVLSGIESALKEKFKDSSIKGRKIAIQGVGNTGSNLLKLVYQDADEVYIADIDKDKLAKIKKRFPKVKIVDPKSIHKQKVDIFSPCALSGVLDTQAVSDMKCKIIAGSANNQLNKEIIGKLLHQMDILYAPDYIINAGGLISVVDEMERKRPNPKRIQKRIDNIGKSLKRIFIRSKKEGQSCNKIADDLAKEILKGA